MWGLVLEGEERSLEVVMVGGVVENMEIEIRVIMGLWVGWDGRIGRSEVLG